MERQKSWSRCSRLTAPEFPSSPHGERIYTSGKFGPWGIVVWEHGYDSLAELEAFEKEFWGTPGAGYLARRGMEFVESRGNTSELWTVEHVK
jgi:hypothetical protein